MSRDIEIQGETATGFETVKEAFQQNFARRRELGAAVAVYYHGEKVVDLWAGRANKETDQPWEEDTIAPVFSVTKGLAALCMLILQSRGGFDYDAPIAEYWPEFAKNGKSAITVRELMNHRSGLAGIRSPITLDDLDAWDPIVEMMENETPVWEPGSQQGYHAVSYGLYLRELFERIANKSIGTFLKDEVCEPLGADVYLGLPESEQGRVARMYGPKFLGRIKQLPGLVTGGTTEGRVGRALLQRNSTTRIAFAEPAPLGFKSGNNFNTRRIHAMELPWCGAIASARGIAGIYSVLAQGGSANGLCLAPKASLAAVHERQSWSDRDAVIHKSLGWSQGFLKEEEHLFSPNPESFGHAGMGGALGWADPVSQVGFGYVPNQMSGHIRSPRAIALCHAVYEAIG